MKDNWITPFQEKLGDYEFALPDTPVRTRTRWIVPLLAGLAAAAAVALLLLLPTTRSTQATIRLPKPAAMSRLRSPSCPEISACPGKRSPQPLRNLKPPKHP